MITSISKATALLLPLLLTNCIVSSEPSSPSQIVNLDLAPICCPGPNILDEDCKNTTLLVCHHGSYIMDPLTDPEDTFQIMEDGRIIFKTGGLVVDKDMYCVGEMSWEENEAKHLVARVCFEDPNVKAALFTLKGTLAFISVIFLSVTIYVYHTIMMRDTQDRVVRISLIVLLFLFLSLGATQLFSDVWSNYPVVCTSLGFMMHFFAVAYFSWLNVVMANVWKSVVVPRWAIDEYKWYMWNHIYAWSVPIAIQVVMVLGHVTEHEFLKPRIGENSCFFTGGQTVFWYMYVPIALMLILNVFLFVWTCMVLQKYGADFNPEKRVALKYRVMMYLKFFLLVGLSWIFEVISFTSGEHAVWIIFDIINALHGFLLFLILVVFRPRVKRELAGKKICGCLHTPSHWRNELDVEHQRLNDDEGTMEFNTPTMINGH